MDSIYVIAELYMGDQLFEQATLKTERKKPSSSLRWGQWRRTVHLFYSKLPRESVICFTVYGVNSYTNKHHPLAWVRLPIIDQRNRLQSGRKILNMWAIPVFKAVKDGPKTDPFLTNYFKYRGTTRDHNLKIIEPEQCQLYIEFDTFCYDVIAPKYNADVTNLSKTATNSMHNAMAGPKVGAIGSVPKVFLLAVCFPYCLFCCCVFSVLRCFCLL